MKIILFFLFWISSLLTGAQEKRWTLDECIRYAVDHSTKRAKQEAQNEIYKQNKIEAIGGLFPSLNAETEATQYYGRVFNRDTYKYVNNTNEYNQYEIYSSFVLFDGFSQLTQVKIEKLNRLKGHQQLQDAIDMLAYETMEIFFNVQYFQGTEQLAFEQLQHSIANLKQVKRMEELGMKSAPDVAELQAKEAEDRYILTKQKNLLIQELIKLKDKMNFPMNQDFKTANYEIVLKVDSLQENAFDIYQKALAYSPKILASQKGVESSTKEVQVSRANFYPKLSLIGGYNTYFSRTLDGSNYISFKEQLNNNQNYYIGLSLKIPIFNGLSRSTDLKRSKQRLIIARNEHEEVLREVYSEIEKTVADVNGLADEYKHSIKRTQSMKIAHQVNQRKYDEGLISALELNTSSNRLLNAQVEELYTNLKYQMKYKLLNYYKGQRIINP